MFSCRESGYRLPWPARLRRIGPMGEGYDITSGGFAAQAVLSPAAVLLGANQALLRSETGRMVLRLLDFPDQIRFADSADAGEAEGLGADANFFHMHGRFLRWCDGQWPVASGTIQA